MATSKQNVEAQVLKELVVYDLTRGQIGRASKLIKESELLLRDSVFMTRVRARYPQVDSADN